MSASEQSGLAASEAETRLGLVAVQSIVVSCSMAVGLGWILGEHLLDVGELDQHAAIDLRRAQFPDLDPADDRVRVDPEHFGGFGDRHGESLSFGRHRRGSPLETSTGLEQRIIAGGVGSAYAEGGPGWAARARVGPGWMRSS